MNGDKELTKSVHNKDIKKRALYFAAPGNTLCDSAVGVELGVLCPTKKKRGKR